MSDKPSSRRPRLDPRFDWVGEPDQLSKIRPIQLRRLPNETALEAKYREDRERLNQWNSRFWAEHNALFARQKAAFIEQHKGTRLLDDNPLSADEMSRFYKRFLDERREALIAYNKTWYRRNLSLIWPAVCVNFIRWRRALLRR